MILRSMAMRLVSNFKLASLAPLECFGGFAQQLASLSSRMLHESAALAGQDVRVCHWFVTRMDW